MPLTPDRLRKLRRLPAQDGNRLRAARELLGLTQVELSRTIGVTQSAISDLERQRWSSTTVETARRFSEFFGCAIEDLFPARESVAS